MAIKVHKDKQMLKRAAAIVKMILDVRPKLADKVISGVSFGKALEAKIHFSDGTSQQANGYPAAFMSKALCEKKSKK